MFEFVRGWLALFGLVCLLCMLVPRKREEQEPPEPLYSVPNRPRRTYNFSEVPKRREEAPTPPKMPAELFTSGRRQLKITSYEDDY